MSDNKRYYWLKLDETFFEDDTMAWIEEQENGKDYLIFYLKLCLKSLKDDGKLIRYVGQTLMPYDIPALAKYTDTKVDTVAVAMKLFERIGLVEYLDTGEIYLAQIGELIGSETDVAKRVRKSRARKLAENSGLPQLLQCNTDVTKCNTEYRDKSKSIEIEKEDIYSRAIPDIVSYLNEKVGANYKPTTAKTKTLIKARIDEGFSVDDFKRVIDKKTSEWRDTDMAKYLRPETLFGTKFESYLNQKEKGESTGYEPDYEHGIVL